MKINIKKHYDDLAPNYEAMHPIRKEAIDFIVNYLSESKLEGAVIDFGGGTGALLEQVKNQTTYQGNYIVLDLSPEMCQLAEQRNLTTINASYEATNLPDQSVALAIFHESIHHSTDHAKLQEELKRVLKTNGEMLVFFQIDWAIEPGNETIDSYVNYARSKRKSPQDVIEKILGKQFKLHNSTELVSQNKVDQNFVKHAVINAAISYWDNIPLSKRMEDMEAILKDNYILKRKVLCFHFKND